MSTIEKIKKDMKDIDDMLNRLASGDIVVEETKKISKLIQEGLNSTSRLVDEDVWTCFAKALEEEREKKRIRETPVEKRCGIGTVGCNEYVNAKPRLNPYKSKFTEDKNANVDTHVKMQEYFEVDHPSHYNLHPKGIECIDVVESMSFNIGNAIKYLWRQGLKGDSVTDLKKAIWYIQREISNQSNQN